MYFSNPLILHMSDLRPQKGGHLPSRAQPGGAKRRTWVFCSFRVPCQVLELPQKKKKKADLKSLQSLTKPQPSEPWSAAGLGEWTDLSS